MPDRSGYIASGLLHLFLVLLFIFGLPNLFRQKLPEATPLVVQIVKIGPETRATEITHTPPQPEAKPEIAQPSPPKPAPPKPVPPAPKPPQPPAAIQPPAPTPLPPAPLPKPQPPTPPTPAPQPKPVPPPPEAKPMPPPPPPPVPAEKPMPPPPAAKPAPPQPVPAPPPPKPTPPKPQPGTRSFDSLLRNLEKSTPASSTPDAQRPDTPPQRASSQPIAPLGSQLTASELDLVMEQIYQCWDVPAGARDATGLTPTFRVAMNPDATVQGVTLLNTDRYSDPFFRAAADSARRALLNPRCSPLKLPLDKFAQWQTFTITFDPRDVDE